MLMRYLWLLSFLLPFSLVAQPLDYSNIDNWLSHPDRPADLQKLPFGIDVVGPDTTVLTRETLPNPTSDTGVDVFYVYPTQDPVGSLVPQTLDNRTLNPQQVRGTFLAQGNLFRTFGRVYAPWYRQTNAAGFFASDTAQFFSLITTAYHDVEAAFDHYLANHNNGNQIVIVAHSQGAYHALMLLRRRFDNNPQLRDRLLTAFLGGIAYIYTEPDSPTGGALENISLCGDSAQCGCIHAWRSYAAGQALELDLSLTPLAKTILTPDYLYTPYDTTKHIVRQDSLIYPAAGRTHSRLLRSPTAHGSSAYVIAYDSLYTARYERQGNQQVALMLDFAPSANDQRPDFLANQYAANANFDRAGYHDGDFWVYGWDALQLTQAKLDGGCTTVSREDNTLSKTDDRFWYEAQTHTIRFDSPATTSHLKVFNSLGQSVAVLPIQNTTHVSLPPMPAGIYITTLGTKFTRFIVRH